MEEQDLNIIRKMAWNFESKTNIDWADLFGEAALAYAEALENFDPENGAKFTTFAWWCMKNHLINYCKKENKHQQHYSEIAIVDKSGSLQHSLSGTVDFGVGFTYEHWPKDCKETIQLILESPEAFTGKTPNFKRTDSTPLQRVKERLRSRGWTHERIQGTIREIKSRLAAT